MGRKAPAGLQGALLSVPPVLLTGSLCTDSRRSPMCASMHFPIQGDRAVFGPFLYSDFRFIAGRFFEIHQPTASKTAHEQQQQWACL